MAEAVLLAVLAVPIVVWVLTKGRPARTERPERPPGPRKRWWQP